ncbi:ROK family protein [Chimaeribacter arupi]|uniref:ROK family protein n=2 Tax=Yersiniaceae TaxID=1903411 RepID=A0A2N5ENG8_9GAMM|nr:MULTISPECIES: ROK family protein [Yersiniaceae]MBS0969454.1 ROK family protein [Nissabacter archeti]MDV5140237.1 ROK family protein [Chimaeribacter arupi]PLR30113.1 ROK family protein [Chimaeribacter arupi]PLR47545.1 ROK family protein [Chimaeribacter arupi]PLR50214.1 ROK family protein [Chimaeribacter arupi]
MTRTTTVIDIGGTHMRWADWSLERGLGERGRMPTPSFYRHPDFPVSRLQALLVDAICEMPPQGKDAVAGISFGAAMNHLTGTVYASAPLWADHEVPFDLLSALNRQRSDVDWRVVNDVTAALLHVISTPLCAQDRKVMLVTVSTGIAARTIDRITGHMPFDAGGLQGEIGHLPAAAALAGEPVVLNCDCGAPEHLSAYASGRGIAKMAQVLRERQPCEWAASMPGRRMAEGYSLEEAFKAGVCAHDSMAIMLLNAVTAPVADVLRTALCLDPDLDRIILTGGVAVSLGEHYRTSVISHLNRQGLYLTGKLHPRWAEDRIVVYEADCLIGAGIAATMEARQ